MPRTSTPRSSKAPPPSAKPTEKLVESAAPQLLSLQLANAASKQYSWIVLITGSACSGRGETVNHLSDWLDTRHVRTLAWDKRNDVERARPWLYRYWHDLPPRGAGAFLFGAWYNELFTELRDGKIKKKELTRRIKEIEDFERTLTDDGTALIKVHLDLSPKAQQKRIESFHGNKELRWRVQPDDFEELASAKAHRTLRGHLIDVSSWPHAPWHIIDASREKARDEAVSAALLDAFRARATQPDPAGAKTAKFVSSSPMRLAKMPTHAPLERDDYKVRMAALTLRLGQLQRDARFAHHGLVVAFEGPDAAGKGGAIRRVTRGLDARYYRVVPIAAPSEAERARPYLWRFWEMVPPRGKITLFDRSWYGRVLVERVEGFAKPHEWQRAYDEIRTFEQELVQSSYVVVKFWMHTSKEEQLRRFQERQDNEHKSYKLTAEDLRNRKKWDDYQIAASDMIERTHDKRAPWVVIPGDNKYHARVHVLETLIDALENAF